MNVDQLEPMGRLMADAVLARELPASVEMFEPVERVSVHTSKLGLPNRAWLRFEAAGKTYIFSSGLLAEQIEGDSSNAWRHINGDAFSLMSDKHALKNHLLSHGFSVPNGHMYRRRNMAQALAAFEAFDGPVCVKPNSGSEGIGVFPGITERSWFEIAIEKVAELYPKIVVEESVSGTHFRFFYIAPHIAAIRMGVVPSVEGDGRQTITDLIAQKNRERARRRLVSHLPIETNRNVEDYLAMQGYRLTDVLAPGEKALLSGVSNGGAGAETILVDDEVHPSYRRLVEKACQSVPGLNICGVDIVIADEKKPAGKNNYWILEFNNNPTILGYHYPWEGRVIDICGCILNFLMDRAPSTDPQGMKKTYGADL